MAQFLWFLADGQTVRLLKFIAFVAIVAGLFSLWQGRDGVVSAYRDDPTATELRLDSLDIAFDKTPVAPSPHALALAPDTRRIKLPTVPPKPEPVEEELPSMGGGRSRMNGIVYGPEGPVAGATVRIERHTLDGFVSADVGTGADGRWSATGLRGGRYSIRAFLPGSLTSGAPEVFLLEAGDKLALDITMVSPPLGNDGVAVGQTHLVPGEPAFIAITLGRWIVDAEGRLVRLPEPAVPLLVSGLAPVSVLSSPNVTSDAGGAMNVVVECAEVGPAAVNLTGDRNGVLFAVYVELPPCSFSPPAPPPGEEVDEDEEDDE